MPRTGLTPDQLRDRVIDAARSRMRLVGFDKVRLTDVAHDVGVSHAALYAHFPNKAALLDAVIEHWLDDTDGAAATTISCNGDQDDRIIVWFVSLYHKKRQKALDDPEIYRAFDVASALAKPFVVTHLKSVLDQLADIVGNLAVPKALSTPRSIAELLYCATAAFHHPTLIVQSAHENHEAQLRQILNLLLSGLRIASNP